MDSEVTRLVFVDGLPGSGKSESSRNLAQALSTAGRSVKLFIETDPTNPLHVAALDPMGAAFADAHLKFNVPSFAAQALERYRDIEYSILPDKTTIFESFPIQSHVRVLFQMSADGSTIDDFWKQVQKAVESLDPRFVYFQESDPERALERILEHRGAEWEAYIVGALEQTPYATSHGLVGREGVVRLMCDYNDLSDRIVESWSGAKIVLPARPPDYGTRDRQMLEFVLAEI